MSNVIFVDRNNSRNQSRHSQPLYRAHQLYWAYFSMFTSPESPAKDAVTYHRDLAVGWEQRYEKPAFQARLRAFEECLAGRDLPGQHLLDAGCGSGTLSRFLLNARASVLGGDAA